VKFSVGEAGPGDKAPDEPFREVVRLTEFDRGAMEPVLDELVESGSVGARGGGCCRILLKPEAPRPCSCSVMMADLMRHIVSGVGLLGAPTITKTSIYESAAGSGSR
jgi:hypothetical protein